MENHVLTSVLPFGYKNGNENGKGKYRFSLCIDLNTDFDKIENNDSKKFITFTKTYETLINQILEKIQFKINNETVYKQEINYCFQNEFVSNVSEVWRKFLNAPDGFSTAENANPEFKPNPLKLSTNNQLESIFKGDVIPNSKLIHELLVASVNTESNNLVLGTVTEVETNKVVLLDQIVSDFTKKLDGINQFALDYNSIQVGKLRDNFSNKNQSLFDSVNKVFDIWTFIDENIILQRLFGKTIDFEISEKYLEKFKDGDMIKLSVAFSGDLETDYTWQHLETQCKLFKSQHLIIVDEEPSYNITKKLEATNYDVGGKLTSLIGIKDKFQEKINLLRDPKSKESEKYLIRKELIQLDTACLTLGINVYDSTFKSIIDLENKIIGGITNNKGNTERFTRSDSKIIYLKDVNNGYRIAAKCNSNIDSKVTALGQREVNLKLSGLNFSIRQLPDEFKTQYFAINTNTGTHALVEDENSKTLMKKTLTDPAIFTWSGENLGMPSVFSVQEDDTNFESTIDEGGIEESTRFVMEYFSNFYAEDYQLIGMKLINDDDKSTGHSFIKLNTNPEKAKILLEYAHPKEGNKKLLFGRSYSLYLTSEYKNGWAPSLEQIEKIKQNKNIPYDYNLKLNSFIFKRNEPVKPIEFQLQEPLTRKTEEDYNGTKVEKTVAFYKRDGELCDKLVIRNYSKKDKDKICKTKQKAFRHILPPSISFQQALWHNKIFEMEHSESYRWYMKYHFPAVEGKDYMKWSHGEWKKDPTGRKYTLSEAIEGSTQMREYYPDKWYLPDAWERDEIINYLPDPLSIGFRFDFFKDTKRLIKDEKYEQFEQIEFYFSGKYPKINAWRIILEDYNSNDGELFEVDFNNEEIIIRLDKGEELFVTARTILSENYEKELETYGNYNDFTRYGNNDLLTPPLEFSLVHATQRPLVRPVFNNLLKTYKKQDSSIIDIITTATIEQTGTYRDTAGIIHYLEGNVPTGNVEVYAKWEEYKDDPKHLLTDLDNWTPNDPLNRIDNINFENQKYELPAIFETSVEISKQLTNMEATLNKIATDRNEFKNYATDLQFTYDVRETKFIEKYFWIKNKSKFTAYFPKEWGTIDADSNKEEEKKLLEEDYHYSKDLFNKVSADAFLVRILNNKKPNIPKLAAKNMTLVSVVEDCLSSKGIIRKSSMNRIRLFFERGRLSSGKGERIGFVVNESKSKYNDYLVDNDLVSLVGRDIVSDSIVPYDGLFRNDDVLLTEANFLKKDPYEMKDFVSNENSYDLESFSPKYVEDLGIMTYLPKFDKKLNLWYLDIQMDINIKNGQELHSPFVRFSIVHYQEHSFNYNKEVETKIALDCRISEISKTGFVYVLPTRKIELEVDNHSVITSIELDVSSLKHGLNGIESKFYALIREKKKWEVKWELAKNSKEDDCFKRITHNSSLIKSEENKLDYEKSIFKDYQVVILETEDWGNINDTSFNNLIENKNSRIIQVNTFEL